MRTREIQKFATMRKGMMNMAPAQKTAGKKPIWKAAASRLVRTHDSLALSLAMSGLCYLALKDFWFVMEIASSLPAAPKDSQTEFS